MSWEVLSLGHVFGFIGAALTVSSYLMKSMMPLRLLALLANVFFAVYAGLVSALPMLLLHVLMIPINAKKAWDIRRLTRAIEQARADTPASEWLVPHMKRRVVSSGELLWRRGDPASEMLYVERGQLRIVEYGQLLGPGSVVGEIGLFAPENRRTLTLVTETDCVLHALSGEQMAQLYYQHPEIGFHVVRMVVARLMHDAQRARHADAGSVAG